MAVEDHQGRTEMRYLRRESVWLIHCGRVMRDHTADDSAEIGDPRLQRDQAAQICVASRIERLQGF